MPTNNKLQVRNTPVPESIIPANDSDRLKALYRYEILDTTPEAFFDKITSFATKIFEVPNAFISLVDLDRVWYKSNLSNLQVSSVKREDSLCSVTILEPEEVTVFSDAHAVPSLLSSPYVKAEGGIRFYAGAPLKTYDGYNLGTVCVVDSKPRGITEKEKEVLKDLAALVVEQLEIRVTTLKAVKKHDELYSGTISEVSQPLDRLHHVLEGVSTQDKLPTAAQEMVKEAQEITESIQHNLEDLLKESAKADVPFLLQPVMTSIAEIARSTVQELEALATSKQQEIYFLVATGREMRIDPDLMRKAFRSLVKFGIVYSPPASSIAIDIFEGDNLLHVEFTYDSINLSDLDIRRVFLKQAKLSINPSSHETMSGEDLAQTKKIIEQHRGIVSARCMEKGKSCKIVLEFPIA